jgi:hypothetical protein
VLIEPVPSWVSQYRGLWGYYAHDPAAGEDAPAGPMYNRDGSVRVCWYDPVGWAGLDKVPPPSRELSALQEHIATLTAHQREQEARIVAQAAELRTWGTELAALRGNAHLADRQLEVEQRVRTLSADLDALRKDVAQGEVLLEALARRQTRLESPAPRAPADPDEPDERRVHIRRRARPATAAELRWSRGAELWAAVSVGILLVSMVLLLVTAREFALIGLCALLATFLFVDALFRRGVGRFVRTVTNALALVTSLILVYEFFWQLAVLGIVAAGAYVLWDNLRELHR